MRMRLLVLGCLSLALGCGSVQDTEQGGDAPTTPASPSVSPSPSPLDLVGRWYVDVPGERPGATMVVLGTEMTVFLECGVLHGASPTAPPDNASSVADEPAITDEMREGSDGCNGKGGGFLLGQEGRLLTTSGNTTLIGCESSPVASWVDGASRAGLLGDLLVFYDAKARELGRVVPS